MIVCFLNLFVHLTQQLQLNFLNFNECTQVSFTTTTTKTAKMFVVVRVPSIKTIL